MDDILFKFPAQNMEISKTHGVLTTTVITMKEMIFFFYQKLWFSKPWHSYIFMFNTFPFQWGIIYFIQIIYLVTDRH